MGARSAITPEGSAILRTALAETRLVDQIALLTHKCRSDGWNGIAVRVELDLYAAAATMRDCHVIAAHRDASEPGGNAVSMPARWRTSTTCGSGRQRLVAPDASAARQAGRAAERLAVAGAKASAPGKDVDATIVMGVNDKSFDRQRHRVISNASCTTNCVAPMAKVLQVAFGIERAFMTTVHAYTNDQNVLDAPHKNPRRARSAAVNIIPTTTGAARAVGSVLPELAGRLGHFGWPVVDGSLVDLAVLLDRDVTVADINDAFIEAANRALAGILRYTTEPVVSSDVIGDPASCILDGTLIRSAGRFAKVFGWYDNEWAHTCRLADLTRLVGRS
jgi:glyceraldehyde-3-phosphate dehydrogenase/erythrose-4-phosphate dehydrogenase